MLKGRCSINIWAWSGLLGIIIFTPVLAKKVRTDAEKRKARVAVLIVLSIIMTVIIFKISLITAFLVGAIAMIVVNKERYSKKRLIIYVTIAALIGIAMYFLLKGEQMALQEAANGMMITDSSNTNRGLPEALLKAVIHS
ncbi:hypothetical protein [Salinicoccus bachuensis]|uniref:Uncharacterized protein n=1 Tax=Salinicoccus bachuensis TaxID=3136731 RepID=A0ABZ3CMF9_9STAP